MRRLRPADWGVAVFALATLVDTSLAWRLGDARSGWATLGWAGDVIVVLTIVAALMLVVRIALRRPIAAQIATSVVATLLSLVAAIVVVVTVLGETDRCPASWVGVAVFAALAIACWRSMADERTDDPGSVFAPPAPRPIPPPRS